MRSQADSVGPYCGLEGFTRSADENVIQEFDQPIQVGSVKGLILSEGGEWPGGTHVVFEIRRRQRTSTVWRTTTDPGGWFVIPEVPPGEYCFKATVNGWDSVTGTIIVIGDADPSRLIQFEMRVSR